MNCSGRGFCFTLPAEIGIALLINLNRSGRLIPATGSIETSLFPLLADRLPAISYLQRATPRILDDAAERILTI